MKNEVKISKTLVGSNASSIALASGLNIVIMLWAQHHLLTHVSPEEFSLYPLVTTWLFLTPLLSIFFSSPCARYITIACAKGQSSEITQVISTILPCLIAVNVGILALGFLAAHHIDQILTIDPAYVTDAKLMLRLVVITSVISMLARPLSIGFQVRQRLAAFHGIELAGELLRLSILAFLIFQWQPRIIWLVVADSIATPLTWLVRVGWSHRILPELSFSASAIRWALVPELLRYGAHNVGVMVALFLRSATPIWILNRFAASIDTTIFHLGQTAYRHAFKAWMPIRNSVSVPLMAMHARQEIGRLRHAYYRGARLSLWLIMSIAMPVIVFHAVIIRLYAGERYAAAGIVMALLLCRYPVQLINNLLPQIARAKGELGGVCGIMISSEIIRAALIIALVWGFGYGAIGAAVCSLATAAITEWGLLLPLGLRLIQGCARDSIRQSFIPGLLPSLGGGIVWQATLMLLQPDSVWQLALATLPGYVVYLTVTCCCLQPEDRRDINRLQSIITQRVARYALARRAGA